MRTLLRALNVVKAHVDINWVGNRGNLFKVMVAAVDIRAFPSSLSSTTKAKEKTKIPQEILGKRNLSKSLSSW